MEKEGLEPLPAHRGGEELVQARRRVNLVRYDFAKVEAINAIAPFYATGGWVLWRIHFYEREPMIAAAEYHHPDHHDPAYLVFCWASMMDTQRELFERLESLREAMQAHSEEPDETFWPAGLAFVAASEWGAARALCMARALLSGWVDSRSIAAWYHGNAGWHVSDASSAWTGVPPEAMPPLEEPIEFLRPAASVRKLGNRKLKNILAGSLFAGRGGHKLNQSQGEMRSSLSLRERVRVRASLSCLCYISG